MQFFDTTPVIAISYLITLLAALGALTWALLSYPLSVYKKASARFAIANLLVVIAGILLSANITANPLIFPLSLAFVFLGFWYYYRATCYFFYLIKPSVTTQACRLLMLIAVPLSIMTEHSEWVLLLLTATCSLVIVFSAGHLKYYGLADKFSVTAARVLCIPDVALGMVIYCVIFSMLFFPGKALAITTTLPGSYYLLATLIALVLLLNISAMAMTLTRLIFRMRYLADRDQLTGLLNRRAIFKVLERAWKAEKEQLGPFSVLMIDIDHFKAINDQYGHAEGDAAICRTSELIKSLLRETDFVARYGGEEFLVILPGAEPAAATQVAQKLCQQIATEQWHPETSPLTVSIGYACSKQSTSIDDLIMRADKALYRAKEEGRNRARPYSEVHAHYDASSASSGSS